MIVCAIDERRHDAAVRAGERARLLAEAREDGIEDEAEDRDRDQPGEVLRGRVGDDRPERVGADDVGEKQVGDQRTTARRRRACLTRRCARRSRVHGAAVAPHLLLGRAVDPGTRCCRNTISMKTVCGHSQPHQTRPTAAVDSARVTMAVSATGRRDRSPAARRRGRRATNRRSRTFEQHERLAAERARTAPANRNASSDQADERPRRGRTGRTAGARRSTCAGRPCATLASSSRNVSCSSSSGGRSGVGRGIAASAAGLVALRVGGSSGWPDALPRFDRT